MRSLLVSFVFLFHDTAPTETYTYGHPLPLHDALPLYAMARVTITARPTASPIRRCCWAVRSFVTSRNTGSEPMGLQIVKRATALVTKVGPAIASAMAVILRGEGLDRGGGRG